MNNPEKTDLKNETPNDPVAFKPIPQPSQNPMVNLHPIRIMTYIQTIIVTAAIMATAFTMWTPANLFNNPYFNEMLLAEENIAIQTTPTTSIQMTVAEKDKLVGIIAGHWKYDSGAVCDDGLTEVEVNVRIATLVKQQLIDAGYQVELLAEKDPKLDNFEGLAIISIHNDSCVFFEGATGFKIASADNLNHPEQSQRLKQCVIDRYQKLTNLQYHANTITEHMRDYHAFGKINPNTPAIIIETGFLNLDRDLLTKKPDLVAKGVADGILCFLNNEPVNSP